MHGWRGLATTLGTALLVYALVAVAAFAHAELLGSKPRHGQTLERSPSRVLLTFDEGIDTGLVQLQVEDAEGRRADRGEPFHPGGREELVAVRLRPRLEGTYIASYRVISEDGHPVAKRTVFEVRPPMPAQGDEESAGGQMAPPAGGGMQQEMQEEAGGHDTEAAGPVTDAAFTVTRGLGYLAIALAIGGSVFLLVVWLPALARHAGAGPSWRAASQSFVAQLKRVMLGAIALGLVATAVAIVMEAATAAGVSFWAALDRDMVEPVFDTQVVQAWSARFVLWLVLGLLVVLALRPRRAPVLRRAALGAEGLALRPVASGPQRLLLMGAVVGLALTAPMAGHSGTHSPEGLLICVGTAHVLCMSIWLGGLAMLLIALGLVRRALAAGESTPLLASVVGRFSRMATVVVAVLVATGITQAVVLVGSVDALVETGYGRLVVAKVSVLLLLLALGAYNQRRSLPRLRALAAGGEAPGRAARVLRRAVAAEVAFLLAVLAVTSVLVATQPPAS
jgi:copper transport protein